MKDVLAMVDGKLCVRSEHVNYSEPTIRVLYHAVCGSTPNYHKTREPKEGDLLARKNAAGWQVATDPKTYRETGRVYVERAIAVRNEHFDLPCPKVRKGIETRWHEGSWQKRLKAGWVDA